jgi:hypothetical protein
MAEAGVIEALVQLLEGSNPETRALSAVALAHLVGEASVRRRVWSAGAVPPLVEGLNSFGYRGTEGAAVCLEKLVALKEAAEQMVEEPVRSQVRSDPSAFVMKEVTSTLLDFMIAGYLSFLVRLNLFCYTFCVTCD